MSGFNPQLFIPSIVGASLLRVLLGLKLLTSHGVPLAGTREGFSRASSLLQTILSQMNYLG